MQMINDTNKGQENLRCSPALHYLPSVSPKQIFFFPVHSFFPNVRLETCSADMVLKVHLSTLKTILREIQIQYIHRFSCVKLLFLSSQSRHFTAISFYRSLSWTPKSLSLNQRHTDRPARCVSVYCPETAICFHDAVIFSFSLSVKIQCRSIQILITSN